MRNKLLVFLIMIFISCGCSATYTIDTTNDYNELINIKTNYNDDINEISNSQIAIYADDNVEDIDGNLPESVLKYSFSRNNDNLISNYKFNSFNNFQRSTSVESCFKHINVTEGSTYKIETDNTFLCFENYPKLEELTINIIANNVVSNNADKVDGNTYSWTFTKDNYRLKSIIIEYRRNTSNSNNPNNSQNNKESDKKNNVKTPWYLYLLLSLFFVILFGIIFFSKKMKK